ncbi:energy-coupling factor ABC transporter substrate-binding protein [Romboutsia lituseburensis]|uniref:energy-coupling factor ABC transporter substrate-binding protein n=1 Tax=Romboutsia lituseburensis TaxID=1537 RepID=UPI00215A1812|nr:energy-coupling factor ABC transporter substrate-binding protein [Romboutsia lituseburensis]MCR8745539.1 energy-coupling factor ABC transporter substrate-binding protein [Romboutsia lituseburensis]
MSTNAKQANKNKDNKKANKNNFIMLLIAVALIVTPLVLKPGAEYGGADGQAEDAITEISPDYKPWFSSLYEPPSGEIESLLFATQAALGAGIIGYYLGSRKAK